MSTTIPFARPWLTDEDRAAVDRVLQGHVLTHGPECEAFEHEFAEFLGDDVHCVTVSSCMAALHLAYLDLGIGPGDEVVVAAQTHVATAHAVEWVGARPVFADCDPATGNVTPQTIADAITTRTRAIGLVHFLGIPCDMDAIIDLAQAGGLPVVEDCALAVGARSAGRHVGTAGHVGTFSFYPVKHLTTAEGGMFVTRHADVAARVRRLRAFGVDRGHAERRTPGVYDVPTLGLNYRMSELQAALGRTQLGRAHEFLTRRRDNFERVREPLTEAGLRVLDAQDDSAESAHYALSAVLPGGAGGPRERIVEALAEAGVGTSLYYPHPVPRLSYYRDRYGYIDGFHPHAEEISDASVTLPVGPHLSDDDAERVAATVAALAEVHLGARA